MTFKHKLARRLAQLRDWGMLAPIVVLVACTAGEPTGTSSPTSETDGSIVINPRSVTLETNQPVVFRAYESAEVGSALVSSIEWTATGGVIGTDGTYSSSVTGEFKVRGKRKGNPRSVPDTSVVIVVPPQPTLESIEISPGSASVGAGGQRTFVATGRLSDGSTVPIGVTWSATGGSIDPGGVYTAGSAAGTYRVIAQGASSPVADTSTVTVTATPTLQAVILTPDTVTVQGGTSHQFATVARMSDGSTGSASVTYTATGGTISAAGLYAAGSTAGTYRVIATQAGGTFADTSRVTVQTTAAVPPPSDANGELAAKADSFWHSVGVNTHVTYVGGSAYDRLATDFKQSVRDSYIRHFRDAAVVLIDGGVYGPAPGADGWMEAAYGKARVLYNEVGVKFTLTTVPVNNNWANLGQPANLTKLFQFMPSAAIEAWEGLNEHDLSGRSNWAAEIRQWQQRLWNEVQADPALRRSVLGPSVTNCSRDETVGDLSPYFDYHVMHPYPGAANPQWAVDFNTPCLASLNLQRKPIQATETGYQTNFAVTYHDAISEAGEARYVPRLYLVNFNAGWPRSHDYELLDHSPEGFGFIRPDGSWKPSLTALSRLLKLIADSGSAYTPGRLGYTLSGDQTNVKRTLLQKRDGRFYLALWQEVKSYDFPTRQLLTVAPRNLTLTLAQPAATVRVYRPNQSATPIQQATAVTSVSLSVSDEVLVIEITR
jgi:hypothetical protein